MLDVMRSLCRCCRSVILPFNCIASPAFWGLLSLFAFLWCLLIFRWQEMDWHLAMPITVREAGAGIIIDHTRKKPRHTYQRINEKDGVIKAEYGFRNYNNDSLNVSFSISQKELASYRSQYGYLQAELDELLRWQRDSLKAAYQSSFRKDGPTKEELQKRYEEIRGTYLARYRALLVSRGFVISTGNVAAIDIPTLAKRNVKDLRVLAAELQRQGERRGYHSDRMVSAALSLVQTALLYEEVPMEVNGRRIGGVYPPVETIFKGKGDCGSKSALLASILLNWDKVKLVGVSTATHYLIGILRNPIRGEAFVEYNGMRYVLMEPAGPAWLPPGSIGPETEAVIKSGAGVRIAAIAH